jgi:hypothetical protein
MTRRTIAEREAISVDELEDWLEEFRQSVVRAMKPLADASESFRRAIEQDPVLRAMQRGEESPNPVERERFRKLGDQISDKTLHELREWFDQLRPAERRAGRRKAADQVVLEKMRPLVENGMKVRKAAGMFASEVLCGGTFESARTRLQRKYADMTKSSR